jgi:hypothetical protein
MKRFLVTVFAIGVFTSGFGQVTKPEDSPVMKELARFIGGKWVGTLSEGITAVELEFSFERLPDGVGISGKGIIGKNLETPVYTYVTFGWDSRVNKVFYLEVQNSENVFFGYVSLVDKVLEFEFGPINGDIKAYKNKNTIVDNNTITAVLSDTKTNTEIMKLTLKRVR